MKRTPPYITGSVLDVITLTRKSDIMTRIQKSRGEFFDRTGNIPKFLVVGESEESELLTIIREGLKRTHPGRLVPQDEARRAGVLSLEGCQVMGMSILLEKDLLSLRAGGIGEEQK